MKPNLTDKQAANANLALLQKAIVSEFMTKELIDSINKVLDEQVKKCMDAASK